MTVHWPMKITICLECGQATNHPVAFPGTCENEEGHGPAQTVSVVPTQQLEELRDALKPIAEVADRLAAKGKLETEPGWDEDLTFPADVELSVTDLKRALAALTRVDELLGGEGR